MTPDGVAVAVMIILLFPMGYFTLASPAFLLVKLDIQPVAQLLRGMFNAHFLVMRIAGVIGALAFLLVKLDIPPVTQLLRGMFNIQFRMMSVTGVIGTAAFLVAGRPLFAIGIGLIAAFAIWGRKWFMQRMDDQLDARDAGDIYAVRRLRRLHWSGMLGNAVLLAAIVASIPYVATTA